MLKEQYHHVRQASTGMVQPLETEDFVLQPVEFVSPPRWNLAHTTWFFEEFVLAQFTDDYRRYHPQYAFLFNSYYNAVGDRTPRPHRGHLSRPTVQEIMDYRSYVDEQMDRFFDSDRCTAEAQEMITLGLHHEQQHQELFYTDLKYTFHLNPLFPVYKDVGFCEQLPQGDDRFIRIPEGIYRIGYEGDGFCFDNERMAHNVFLQSFEIQNRLVTNREYMDFIEDGGYESFSLWHEEGWNTIAAKKAPLYWMRIDGIWHHYTLAGLRPVNPDHVLSHVTYFEAAAFARWMGCRLPTEFEWEVASDSFAWGQRWEWTESAYLPYPGFQTADNAAGEYNGKFMVNQKVLRGASAATPAGHARKTYRNFFHPHIGYQYNGIRLARD